MCTCTMDNQLGMNGEAATEQERPLLDDLGDFLCGRADLETRERIGALLDDPNSFLRQFIEGARVRAEALTGWTGTSDESAV